MVKDGETHRRPVEPGSGDRRQADRRASDRRKGNRRAGQPPWRGPLAYAGYGVLASLLATAGLRALDSSPEAGATQAAIMEPDAGASTPAMTARTIAAASPAARDAPTLAHFEILLAEGESAVGQIVRTELYCQSIAPVAVRSTRGGQGAGLAGIIDAEGRVGGSECRWSDESRSSDFLLVIPPDLAGAFTAMPEIEMNFVLRRRVRAQVEWLGRSDPLSRRTAGVLRAIEE